jgi:PAS domain S-box-containing protein
MKLQSKITLTVLSVFLISLFFIGMLVFSNSKFDLEKQVIHQLQSASQITENNINTFLDQQENKIELVATQSSLSNEELNQMVALDGTFYDLFMINSSGIVIASSNIDRIGLYRGDREYFVNAINQTYTSKVYFALVPREYSVSVSTPFNGGVLVGAMKLDVFDKLVSDKTGLGETGENLIAFEDENGNVTYFSSRRFSETKIEVLNKEQIKDRPIAPAVRGEESIFSSVQDYRGVEVLASTNYINRTGMGMVSKIDVDEAYSGVYRLQRLTIFLVLIAILLVGFIIYIISRAVSREIVSISEDIDKITKGDLEIQLKKSGIFEVQSLINSLNRILASMKLAILRTGVGKSELGLGEAIKAKEEAEDRFKILYESSADAIMILEPPTWKFTAGNPATLKMFNIKDEKELQSLGPGDLSPKKQPDGKLSADGAKKMIERAMKTGNSYFEWTHKRYKGEEFPASVLLSRFKTKGKEVLQATVRDLSKEKKK